MVLDSAARKAISLARTHSYVQWCYDLIMLKPGIKLNWRSLLGPAPNSYSAERYDPALIPALRCSRKAWIVLKRVTIVDWSNRDIWQTIAEAYYCEAGLLAASFFFPRFVADRKVDTFSSQQSLTSCFRCPPSPARTFYQLHISRWRVQVDEDIRSPFVEEFSLSGHNIE